MNKQPNQLDLSLADNCESFEIMISASMDGDLSEPEIGVLNRHLDCCFSCQRAASEFSYVNSAVETLGREQLGTENTNNNSRRKASPALTVSKNTKTSWLSFRRFIPLAAAASLLVCLAIAAWPNPQPVKANQISPEQITTPILELETLNDRKQRDQDLMLRTLGMDLRAMKLEINHLDPESEERLRLEAQIDSMIAKVRSFESNLD